MKRLVVVMVLLMTIGATAQRKKNGNEMERAFASDLTIEQLASLHTKRLTLALDLNDRQQKQVMEISLEQVEVRKAKFEERKAKKESGELKKPSADERFAMENERLDNQIAHHQKMKEVLSEEQYQTWKKFNLLKRKNGKKKMQERGRRG